MTKYKISLARHWLVTKLASQGFGLSEIVEIVGLAPETVLYHQGKRDRKCKCVQRGDAESEVNDLRDRVQEFLSGLDTRVA